MEFDKSRVYTALNADELKVGSKVIVADTLTDLVCKVNDEQDVYTLDKITAPDMEYRFNAGHASWHLAYFVSEPEEKKLKWTDLKLGDIIRHKCCTSEAMVIQVNKNSDVHILAGCRWISTEELAEDWEKIG